MIYFIALLPILFAIGCTIAALWLRRSRRSGIRCPVYTEAVVVSKVTQMGYRHHSMVEQSAPVVRYQTEHGEQMAAYRKFMPEWQYSYRIGETVQICYEKENPNHFLICRNDSHVRFSNLLLCIAVGTILAYAVLWLQYH